MSQTFTLSGMASVMTRAQEIGVRFRHLMFETTKTIPAVLKVAKDGHSARVVQPRTKKQVAHVTVAYRLDLHSNVLTLAFSICHPDDEFSRHEGKYNALLRFQREESVEILNIEYDTVHAAIQAYIYWNVCSDRTPTHIFPTHLRYKRDDVSYEVKSALRRWSQW